MTNFLLRGELQHVGQVGEKNQVLTNQNKRNSWFQIVKRTICRSRKMALKNIEQKIFLSL